MSYRVEFLPAAGRDWQRLQAHVQRRLAPAIDALAENPRPAGAKALKGRLRGTYRLRSGEWRVAYQMDDADRAVYVIEVGHRSRIYDRARRRGRAVTTA